MVHRYSPQPGPSASPTPAAQPAQPWHPHQSFHQQQHVHQPHGFPLQQGFVQQPGAWTSLQPSAGPQGVPSDQKSSGAVAHLSVLVMPIVLPLLLFFTSTNKPFQRAVALQAAIVQILSLVLSIGATVLWSALIIGSFRSGMGGTWMFGYVGILAVILFGFGMSIMGAAKAGQGEVFYAPVIGRWLARRARAEL